MTGERSLGDMNGHEIITEMVSSRRLNDSEQKYKKGHTGISKLKRQWNYVQDSCSIWLLYLVGLTIVCSTCQADPNQCLEGLQTAGKTWPSGDIIVEYGQSLTIYCMLNENLVDSQIHGRNSSDLVFFQNSTKLQPEYVTVLNKTTIMMYIEEPAPSNDTYSCKLRLNDGHSEQYETVCLNQVVVGFKPLKPTQFNCVSRNWENLTCTWEPVPNYIATKFSLYFKLPGRGSGRSLYSCPIPEPGVKLPPNTCLWDASTSPVYRLGFEYYVFELNAENVLGSVTFSYRFHHWAHVIPSNPVHLTSVDKTHSSVLLHWNVPHSMRVFPPGLHHKVLYRNQLDTKQIWEMRNITADQHNSKKYFNLTDLQYANTVYEIRVYIKSAKADGEDKWSQPSEITVKTAATRPGSPPRIDIGSFEIARSTSHRDVYIYWQTIPRHLENGDNFMYQVVNVEESGKEVNLQPTEITETYAKFKGLTLNSFKFEIVSTNCEGANEHKAIVYVASQSEMPQEPVAFTKMAIGDGLYKLSWDPSDNLDITNYTIFWCENDRDRPYQCSGYLNWVHVPSNTSVYNIVVPDLAKVYQFAIAANTARASSGMVWISYCTAIHNATVDKMRSVWINRVKSDAIEVGWKLDCYHQIDTIEAFNIHYCSVTDPYNSTCESPIIKVAVKAYRHTINGVLHCLKPFTSYKLTITVLNENGEGLHSDPLYATTLEEAPASLQSAVGHNITNTTMTVERQPPAVWNGTLIYYMMILFLVYITHILNK